MGPTPPPYNPPGSAKKTSTTTIVLIVLGICAVCCVLGVVGFGGLAWFGFNKAKNFATCTVGATELARAINDYADDHGGKLPDAKSWQDEVKPYFAKLAEQQTKRVKFIGTLDPNGLWGCKDETGPGMSGFAFNSDLSGKKIADIPNKEEAIVLFEVDKPAMNLNMPYKDQPIANSPKIMGSPRGWIKVTVSGDVITNGRHSKSSVSFGN
jgi:hypothetical protein